MACLANRLLTVLTVRICGRLELRDRILWDRISEELGDRSWMAFTWRVVVLASPFPLE
jgi:hypothetical protein